MIKETDTLHGDLHMFIWTRVRLVETHILKCKKGTSDLMLNAHTTAFDIKNQTKEADSAIIVTMYF